MTDHEQSRAPIRPTVSLSPYQAVVESITLFDCPTCGAVKGQRCRTRGDRGEEPKQALEQHEDRWRPPQDAHDAGFKYATAQYEGLRARLAVNQNMPPRR